MKVFLGIIIGFVACAALLLLIPIDDELLDEGEYGYAVSGVDDSTDDLDEDSGRSDRGRGKIVRKGDDEGGRGRHRRENREAKNGWYDEDWDDNWSEKDIEILNSDIGHKKKKGGKKGKQLSPDCEFSSLGELKSHLSQEIGKMNTVWTSVLSEKGIQYKAPKVVYYENKIDSACGECEDEGPFYCYLDQTVYLDLDFFVNMTDLIGTGGTFAYSYVIAHEMGHHVQYLLGDLVKYSDREQNLRDKGKEARANLISVQTELQADYYAGVWVGKTVDEYPDLSEDDIENALMAAAMVGDDVIDGEIEEIDMKESDHGTAMMRLYWLVLGITESDLESANTYQYSLKELEDIAEEFLDEEEDEGDE